MKRKILVSLLMIPFLFMVSCQTMPKVPEQHKGAATGAGIGAVAGSVLGAVIGDSTRSTVLGGLIGTLIGGAVGHYYYDQKRTGTETIDQYGYDPAKGPLLKIEDATMTPQIVSPGDKVDLGMTYAVLNSATAAPLNVIEKWEIRHDGNLVGNPEIHVSRAAGTYTAAIPLILPGDAKKGFYIVSCTVTSGTLSDEMKSSFTVK